MNKNYDQIAAIEKAIAEKYGDETVQNPKANWDENKEKWLEKFKDAGMTSNINTQIWNKEGVFRIGRIFMYKDEKAFIACQKIFREFENENSDINRKISSSRGIVLDENILT